MIVPWNAGWTDEQRYEIRPCRYAGGDLAVWMPTAPTGRPVFAKPHMVRQRRSIAEMLCTVCGEQTPLNDLWWFALGTRMTEKPFEGWFATTEAPVHRKCADLALTVCPHLQKMKCTGDLAPFPRGHRVMKAIVGGTSAQEEFSTVRFHGRRVVGALKFAWPPGAFNVELRG